MRSSIRLALLLVLLASPAFAGPITFSDSFSDSNAAGWIFPSYPSQVPGSWSVEGGTLVQHSAGDWYRALVDNLLISDQVAEVRVSSGGYGGIVLWSQNAGTFLSVVVYPAWSGMAVYEVFDGVSSLRDYGPRTNAGSWYDLRVEASSSTGQLAVYLDNTYAFTYTASTPYRTGSSGLFTGNAVTHFDDFSLTGDGCSPFPGGGATEGCFPGPGPFPAPEPGSLLLLGTGLAAAASLAWRKRRQ
jgi:hypothetical protein